MPNGCTLLFEPFVASSVHESLGLVRGNIYGQSTEAIDIGGGVCKHLIARPTFNNPDDTGDIVAMSCNCPDGTVITAEPTFDERGDVVWQERVTIVNCAGYSWPEFLTYTMPCVIDIDRRLYSPFPDTEGLPQTVVVKFRGGTSTCLWGAIAQPRISDLISVRANPSDPSIAIVAVAFSTIAQFGGYTIGHFLVGTTPFLGPRNANPAINAIRWPVTCDSTDQSEPFSTTVSIASGPATVSDTLSPHRYAEPLAIENSDGQWHFTC